eukprot:1175567-Prorocentrum_minimum.AAC.5
MPLLHDAKGVITAVCAGAPGKPLLPDAARHTLEPAEPADPGLGSLKLVALRPAARDTDCIAPESVCAHAHTGLCQHERWFAWRLRRRFAYTQVVCYISDQSTQDTWGTCA